MLWSLLQQNKMLDSLHAAIPRPDLRHIMCMRVNLSEEVTRSVFYSFWYLDLLQFMVLHASNGTTLRSMFHHSTMKGIHHLNVFGLLTQGIVNCVQNGLKILVTKDSTFPRASLRSIRLYEHARQQSTRTMPIFQERVTAPIPCQLSVVVSSAAHIRLLPGKMEEMSLEVRGQMPLPEAYCHEGVMSRP